ncbi:MAG: divergent polysaccharide deacetylase family protein [Alphaproteobacteria bacterium]|nr:divergent polysaccharide deacetylase family protein [Alphaproteobacteria bacterium]
MIDRLKAALAFCKHYWAIAFFGVNVVILITVALVYVISAQSSYFASALQNGQRVIINVETQKVTGGIRSSHKALAHAHHNVPTTVTPSLVSASPNPPAPVQPLSSPATVEVKPIPQATSVINAADKKPSISVLIVDLGLSKSSTELAFQLPSYVGFGFSPYSSQLEEWVTKAKIAGHSIWLHLPLQTIHYPADDPGPYGLLTMLNERQNQERLDWVLGRTPHLNGLYTSNDEVFTQTEANIVPVLSYLKSKNLIFISGNENNKFLDTIVAKNAFPVLEADRIIDASITDKNIRTSLAEAEELTKQFGHVTIVGHAYPLTINILKEWLDSKKHNMNFVSLVNPNLSSGSVATTQAADSHSSPRTPSPSTPSPSTPINAASSPPLNAKVVNTHYVTSTTVKP